MGDRAGSSPVTRTGFRKQAVHDELLIFCRKKLPRGVFYRIIKKYRKVGFLRPVGLIKRKGKNMNEVHSEAEISDENLAQISGGIMQVQPESILDQKK